MTDFEKVLLAIAPHSKVAIRKGFAAAMPECVSRAELTTPLRLAHFLAQTSEESAGLTTTTEETKKVTAKTALLAAPVTATVSTLHPATQALSPIVIGVILAVAVAAIVAIAVSIVRNKSKADELSAAAKEA